MSAHGTPTPKGYEKVAIGRYTSSSLSAQWRPSKVHLSRNLPLPICGAHLKGRPVKDREMGEAEEIAGLCSKCWRKAKRHHIWDKAPI